MTDPGRGLAAESQKWLALSALFRKFSIARLGLRSSLTLLVVNLWQIIIQNLVQIQYCILHCCNTLGSSNLLKLISTQTGTNHFFKTHILEDFLTGLCSCSMFATLHTNDPPSAADAALIRDFLRLEEEEISECDERIYRLEEEIERLEAYRETVSNTAEAHRGMLSPFRRFPQELLSEIFIHCVPDAEESQHPARDAPLLLCWVSQKWRQVALSTPTLWTSLHFHDSFYEQKSCRLDNLWFTQSRALPLDFSIICSSQNNMPVLDAYVSQAHRWRRVKIARYPESQLAPAPLPQLLDVSAPAMESAAFFFHPFGEAEVEWALKLMRSAATLRSITWAGPIEPLFQLSLVNLTSFNSESDMPTIQFLRLCQLAPQLKECNVYVGSDGEDVTLLHRVNVVHPTLQDFALTADNTSYDLGLLFSRLTVPALKHAKINGDGSIWPTQEFSALLARSACTLNSLSIGSFTIAADDLISLLQRDNLENSLTELDIHRLLGSPPNLIPDAVLTFLASPVGSAASTSPSLPRLEKLALVVEPSSQTKLLENIANYRCPSLSTELSPATLTELRINIMLPVIDDVQVEPIALLKVLRGLEEVGIDVQESRVPCRIRPLRFTSF